MADLVEDEAEVFQEVQVEADLVEDEAEVFQEGQVGQDFQGKMITVEAVAPIFQLQGWSMTVKRALIDETPTVS